MFECLKRLFGKKEVPTVSRIVEPPVVPLNPIDMAAFKINLSAAGVGYKESQWDGYSRITDKFFSMGHSDLRWLAYILATALHETAHTMHPVSEYGGEAYLRSKAYYPFYGRGYVQLTWAENYAKYGIKDTPEMALDPSFSAFVIVDGMFKGTFTSRKLSDYFNDSVTDPVNARRIVNGTDRAQLIASYYDKIYLSLAGAHMDFEQGKA